MKRLKKIRIIKILLITILLIINTALVFTLSYNYNLKAKTKLIPQMSLIQKQTVIDKTISSTGFTVDNPNIILNPYKISPLTALIIFETNENVSPQITIKSKGLSKDVTHQFETSRQHYLPIYGLYADSLNEVELKIDDQVYNYQIQTEPLPEALEKVYKETLIDEEKISLLNNDFYFLTPASYGYTTAYDLDGNVRWYLTEKMVWDIDRLANGNLLLSSERLINPPYYTTGLYEISLLGKIYNEYTLPGGYHHDVFELENNNLIVASNNFEDCTVEDYIVEVDRSTGEIVKEIDLKDILDINEGKSANWTEYDWFHNNSVWYDKDSNSLTLSGRHQDAVVNLDYSTLNINYIVGDATGISDSYKKHFLKPTNDLDWNYAQHAAMILPDGNMFMFDNGNNRSKLEADYLSAKDNFSRGVIYNIDSDEMEINQVYQYGKERKSHYYSSYISNVGYINKDHYLIHSGGIAYQENEILNNPPGLSEADELLSYTTEVLNDEKIFELVLNNNNYRAKKMPLYYQDESFINTQAKSLGGLGQTNILDQKFEPLLKTVDDQAILDEYNVDIKKEVDRLVISGEFLPSDQVTVILHRNFYTKEYEVRVSKTPYTAMCLDIFNEKDKIGINKYINDSGLNKTYSIFLEINGIIYKTNKLVDFQ